MSVQIAIGDLVQTRVGLGKVNEIIANCDYPYAMIEFWTGTVCGMFMDELTVIRKAYQSLRWPDELPRDHRM